MIFLWKLESSFRARALNMGEGAVKALSFFFFFLQYFTKFILIISYLITNETNSKPK